MLAASHALTPLIIIVLYLITYWVHTPTGSAARLRILDGCRVEILMAWMLRSDGGRRVNQIESRTINDLPKPMPEKNPRQHWAGLGFI